ncbi:MAG TPA: FAD-dependent monooxygenase, partial [Candidatus Sulfotelmatobacter sp.]|nr:FAD-dependent monooxygenase [Candidatus Sulfotelmatobacter sp.]
MIDVDVLIVGAGPTGLTASIALSRHSVRSLTVERHPGTTIFPRAIGINTRSMEIFRSFGLDTIVKQASFEVILNVTRTRTLMDPDPVLSPPLGTPETDLSPVAWTTCSQFELEPILLREASSHPEAELCFNTQLVSLQQSEDAVRAVIEDRSTGRRSEVRCRYVIAADGAKSPLRQRFGIALEGPGELGHNVNIHFNAPLAERIPHRPIFFHRVQNEHVEGVFFTTDGASRWILLVGYKPRSGESPEDFTDERAVQLIRQGSGMPDLEIDITAKKQWTTQADMATRWVEGRVFLAGDAAHRMTPLGALGMNTGIQDAHNLAWKMAAVLQGWAGTELLDTYEAERRPVAQANVNRSVELLGTGLLDVARPIPPVPSSGRTALDFDIGFEYASTAVIPDGRFDVPTGDSAAVPSSRPGCRAPHVWISHNGNRVSTLDLLGPYFTLLVDEGDTVWSRAARAVGTTTQ